MFSKEQLETVAKTNIASNYKLGDLTGGSGHMGHRSYSIDKMEEPAQKDENWSFTFEYSIYVETEFNYYPDNPPQEDSYSKTVTLNRSGIIVSEEDPKYLGGSMDAMEAPDFFDT
jgi:hypothetical protein